MRKSIALAYSVLIFGAAVAGLGWHWSNLQAAKSPYLVEIYSRANGSSRLSDRNVLLLRVHKNGEVEFDRYPDSPETRNGVPLVIETVRSRFDDRTFNEIQSILDDLRTDDGGNHHKPTTLALDAEVDVTIRFPLLGRIRKIVIEENDARVFPDRIRNRNLGRLMEFVYRENDRLRGIEPISE